jgi:hypothetical protein
VAARDGALDATESRKDGFKKCDAMVKDDSAPSHSCRESCAVNRSFPSIMFSPMDRKRTSIASWVMPRWDLLPRMVCVYSY